jgi:hypothetical protein
VLDGDPGDALDEVLVHARAELDGGSVRADVDGGAGPGPDLRGVCGRQLDLGARALKLELGNAFDGRA